MAAMQEQEFPRIPLFRLLLDDVLLLLFLGVAIYAVSYLLWDVMKIASVAPFPEELKAQIVQQAGGGHEPAATSGRMV